MSPKRGELQKKVFHTKYHSHYYFKVYCARQKVSDRIRNKGLVPVHHQSGAKQLEYCTSEPTLGSSQVYAAMHMALHKSHGSREGDNEEVAQTNPHQAIQTLQHCNHMSHTKIQALTSKAHHFNRLQADDMGCYTK